MAKKPDAKETRSVGERATSENRNSGITLGATASSKPAGTPAGKETEVKEVEARRPETGSQLPPVEGLTLEVKQPRATRKDAGKSHHKQPAKPSPIDNEQLAKLFCTALSGFAIAVTNRGECLMTPGEQGMIVPPLAATLEKMTQDQRDKIDQYANPVLVLAGLALWGLRISQYIQLPGVKRETPKPVWNMAEGKTPVPTDGKRETLPVKNEGEGHPDNHLLDTLGQAL